MRVYAELTDTSNRTARGTVNDRWPPGGASSLSMPGWKPWAHTLHCTGPRRQQFLGAHVVSATASPLLGFVATTNPLFIFNMACTSTSHKSDLGDESFVRSWQCNVFFSQTFFSVNTRPKSWHEFRLYKCLRSHSRAALPLENTVDLKQVAWRALPTWKHLQLITSVCACL